APTTITSALQVETVNAAAASKLVFTTSAATVTAGAASGTITVQRQDAFNKPHKSTRHNTSNLASDYTGTVTFPPVSPLPLANASCCASFTPTPTPPLFPTRRSSDLAPTTITSALQVETVNAAAASKLVFTTSAATVTAGAASGTITVQRQDAFN